MFGVSRDTKELAEFIYTKISEALPSVSVELIHNSIIDFSNVPHQQTRKSKAKKTSTIPPLVLVTKFGETTSGIIGTQLSDDKLVKLIANFKALYPQSKIKKNRPGDFGVSYSFSRAFFDQCEKMLKEECLDFKTVSTQLELSAKNNDADEFTKFCDDIFRNLDDHPNVSCFTSITDQKNEIVRMWKELNGRSAPSTQEF
jgi:hypothetical protein